MMTEHNFTQPSPEGQGGTTFSLDTIFRIDPQQQVEALVDALTHQVTTFISQAIHDDAHHVREAGAEIALLPSGRGTSSYFSCVTTMIDVEPHRGEILAYMILARSESREDVKDTCVGFYLRYLPHGCTQDELRANVRTLLARLFPRSEELLRRANVRMRMMSSGSDGE